MVLNESWITSLISVHFWMILNVGSMITYIGKCSFLDNLQWRFYDYLDTKLFIAGWFAMTVPWLLDTKLFLFGWFSIRFCSSISYVRLYEYTKDVSCVIHSPYIWCRDLEFMFWLKRIPVLTLYIPVQFVAFNIKEVHLPVLWYRYGHRWSYEKNMTVLLYCSSLGNS